MSEFPDAKTSTQIIADEKFLQMSRVLVTAEIHEKDMQKFYDLKWVPVDGKSISNLKETIKIGVQVTLSLHAKVKEMEARIEVYRKWLFDPNQSWGASHTEKFIEVFGERRENPKPKAGGEPT